MEEIVLRVDGKGADKRGGKDSQVVQLALGFVVEGSLGGGAAYLPPPSISGQSGLPLA